MRQTLLKKYYQQELSLLRDLAVEFSKAHPALAPSLSGTSQDPDVERLLEGSAFLSAMLRAKLDDELPEVIHGLMQISFPHYLRPLPSVCLMRFKPRPGLMETINIARGTAIDSHRVEDISCRFQTCWGLDVFPLDLQGAAFEQRPGSVSLLRLKFKLLNLNLDQWQPDRLRLYISAGSYSLSSYVYSSLLSGVSQLRINPLQGGSSVVLPGEMVQAAALREEEGLFPYPARSFVGYRLLQEYFVLPEKFLFIDIRGWEQWINRGDGNEFEIIFEFKPGKNFNLSSVSHKTFTLFVVPACNIFKHDGLPISLDHKQSEYRVVPSFSSPLQYQVYDIEKVTGIARGSVHKRQYLPFEMFQSEQSISPVYFIHHKTSPVNDAPQTFISIAYPGQTEKLQSETLSLRLTCTNGFLAEKLHIGDICKATSSSPQLCEFFNISTPTAAIQPPLGQELLWRYIAHLNLNMLSIVNAEGLRQLLRLYLFEKSSNKAMLQINSKRIDAITAFSSRTRNRLLHGLPLRGTELELEVDSSGFAGTGDLYLFGTIMDRFWASYSAINSFTEFKIRDVYQGELFRWKARIGDRRMI